MFQKLTLAFCLLLLFTLTTEAQEGLVTHQSESTTSPTNGRYEIIQSPLAARWTFRLDRYTGHIDQMVTAKDEKLAWESMSIIGLPKSPLDGKARYQLFTSGIAARYTFLLNVETGQTWQLATDRTDKEAPFSFWSPFVQ
ncbi:MAG TPA: hypothetical protein VKB12_13690 [Pyrinomonadaceae bacterium]|nr:hypothetical protein [Pyrinomonadaceae bacterium]